MRADQILGSVVLGLQSPLTRRPKRRDHRKVRQDEAPLQPSCIRFLNDKTARVESKQSYEQNEESGEAGPVNVAGSR